MNRSGTLIDCRALKRFIAFSEESGQLTLECGVLFDEIIRIFLPRGWFLPVTPGTRFVTVGGAIANDVHGKNHHRRATLGQHVVALQLLRSDGQLLTCSATENPELFKATIGGLGLTGLIISATIQLMPVKSSGMDTWTQTFSTLDEFLRLSKEYDSKYEYSVAWLDCINAGSDAFRGILYCANHAAGAHGPDYDLSAFQMHPPGLSIPCNLPGFVLNRLSVALFNSAYHMAGKRKIGHGYQPLQPFFYPLDGLKHWNRIYGRQGFFQYQFTVPESEKDTFLRILELLSKESSPSFLAVLKLFGTATSPGMLSFPSPGLCLALDISNRGAKTLALLEKLDREVIDAGGRVYPAKDRRMRAESFQAFFPGFREFSHFIDPAFSSDFWRRVTSGVQLA